MTSTIPVHQISSDEENEELDFASRINNNLSKKFQDDKILSSLASTQVAIQEKIHQEIYNKTKYSELKEIFANTDFQLSDDELPDICDASIVYKNKKPNVELPSEDITVNNSIVSKAKYSTKAPLDNKETKLLEKEAKRKERERKKEEKERLRKEKDDVRLMKRATKPGECLKYILVQVDRQLLERSEGSEIVSKMLALELQYRATEQNIPNSISFLRKDPLTCKEQGENEMIIIVMIEDFLSLVHNQMYGSNDLSDCSSDTFCNRCKQWITCSYNSKLTIIVSGLDDYYKSHKNKCRKTYRENFARESGIISGRSHKRRKNEEAAPNLSEVTRIDVETALVSAQVEYGINIRLFENPSKIAEFVGQVAKSVAERPFKLDRSCNDFSWHAESSNTNCVKIDKNGEGLLRLWHQQIRQFTNVGPETAQAIAKKYPSPQCLIKAYRELSDSEGIKLLADIPVRRGVGVLANTRKVGIELSKKIYKFFMEEDPEIYL